MTTYELIRVTDDTAERFGYPARPRRYAGMDAAELADNVQPLTDPYWWARGWMLRVGGVHIDRLADAAADVETAIKVAADRQRTAVDYQPGVLTGDWSSPGYDRDRYLAADNEQTDAEWLDWRREHEGLDETFVATITQAIAEQGA